MRIFTKVPKQIKEKYDYLGPIVRLYVSIRWKLCPFETIENFVPKNGLILDVGCGCGLFSNWMAIKSEKRRIVGIDKSIRRINIARSTVKGRDNINFFIGDATSEEMPEGEYSGITASDFFHHIPDKGVIIILKKIHNKLSVNGRLIIQDIDKKPLMKSFAAYAIDKMINPGKKLYHRSAKRFQHLLSISGFESELIPIDKGLCLSDVLFICKKKTRREQQNLFA